MISKSELQKSYKGLYIAEIQGSLLARIRLFFQRIKKGYDDMDILTANQVFRQRYISMLEELKEYRTGFWFLPKSYENSILSYMSENENYNRISYDTAVDRYIIREDDVDSIIDSMIYHLRMSDVNYVLDLKYPNTTVSTKELDYAQSISDQNLKAFMKLFYLFWNDLW